MSSSCYNCNCTYTCTCTCVTVSSGSAHGSPKSPLATDPAQALIIDKNTTPICLSGVCYPITTSSPTHAIACLGLARWNEACLDARNMARLSFTWHRLQRILQVYAQLSVQSNVQKFVTLQHHQRRVSWTDLRDALLAKDPAHSCMFNRKPAQRSAMKQMNQGDAAPSIHRRNAN